MFAQVDVIVFLVKLIAIIADKTSSWLHIADILIDLSMN